MEENVVKELCIVVLTIFVGMLLMILPLPNWTVWLRPQWLFLILMFWIVNTPHRHGIVLAWSMGILLDLLTGTLLGEHAFVFSVIAYLVIKFHPRLCNFPLWQQTLMIFILCMLNLALKYAVMGLSSLPPRTWLYWLPSFTSALMWPWLSLLLRDCQIKLRLIHE